MSQEISAVEILKNLEKEIQTAKLEAGVYEKQMKELIPVRKEIETICQETYNKEIGELSNYKKQLEEKLATLVQELADEVKSAQESNPDAG